ncbi:hypothetical protein Bca52824_050681 [Brassica carinata]|uniref:Uncharacterized protein n=1 Tax=Brassica carinata TaxID=52824 RepID=A0A8X7R0F5_BRACI|nr:hypothetical protein Bca52824_050681 [Brassica carinata]
MERLIHNALESIRPDAKNVENVSDKISEMLSRLHEVLGMRNPLAFGHFTNHPDKDMYPNLSKVDVLLARTGSNSNLNASVLKTLVLVDTRALCNEELMLDYRIE